MSGNMSKYWIVNSKRKDENGDLSPFLMSMVERADGLNREIYFRKSAPNDCILLLAPEEGDGKYVSIEQTITGQDIGGNDIIQLDLVYDEAAHDTACWEEIRRKRDGLLAECDWTVLTYSPLSTTKKTKWKNYRSALRAVPQTVDMDPKDDSTYAWPTKPE